MVNNVVTIFNDDVARVSKDKCSVLIVKMDICVVIVKEELVARDSTWVLNTYVAQDTNDAYNKWLHWIGKMCKKSISSKYFAKYETCPSFTNGRQLNASSRVGILEELRKKICEAITEDE